MIFKVPPEWEKFVMQQVESGLFQTPDEVISAALRWYIEDRAIGLPQLPGTVEELDP